MLDNMEKSWTIKQRVKKESINSNKETKQLGRRKKASQLSKWENATVEWLSNPQYFQPAYLPKMKVPDDNNSGGVYKNKEEYFRTVCSLWIGLTFGDGNAALNPKCRFKFGAKECGMVS